MLTKYVIGFVSIKGRPPVETAVVFPELLAHSDVAREVFRIRHNVVSAGFVMFDGKKFSAYGRSESLNMGSRPLDSEIINRQLGLIP